MCGNPKVDSVLVFRNPNRTVAKKSNLKFGFPRLFWKPKTGIMQTNIRIKATTFSQCISPCLFNNGVILIMMLMKLQYRQVLQYRRLCLRPSYEWWPVRTMVRLKINETTEPALYVKIYQWPSQNRTEIKPNPQFFSKPKPNRSSKIHSAHS